MANSDLRSDIKVDGNKTLKLAQSLVRIPSHVWLETEVARFLASYMQGMGLDTEIQIVPISNNRTSHNAIGRLEGKSGGPNILLCGHLDTSGWGEDMYRQDLWTVPPYGGEIKEGWLYGVGSLNMKGGVAAIVGAVEALIHSKHQTNGTIVIAGVMGELGGGVGVRHLLKQEQGFDMAVVTEPTNMGIATISVGYVQGWIRLWGELRHFSPYNNPINAISHVIQALGPAYQPQMPGNWMNFEPCPDLPGYPRIAIRKIESHQDDCAIFFDARTVPGQNDDSVRKDIQNLVKKVEPLIPGIRTEIIIPASEETPNFPALPPTDRNHKLVTTLAHCHEERMGKSPQIGATDRLGLAADASHIKAAGITTAEYGPGKHPVWPMTDERIRTDDIVNASQVLADALAILTS